VFIICRLQRIMNNNNACLKCLREVINEIMLLTMDAHKSVVTLQNQAALLVSHNC
jgi:hypothetical protein